MFTKGQSGELAWVTSSNIPSPLKWFLGPFSDFASSLYYFITVIVKKTFLKKNTSFRKTTLCSQRIYRRQITLPVFLSLDMYDYQQHIINVSL